VVRNYAGRLAEHTFPLAVINRAGLTGERI